MPIFPNINTLSLKDILSGKETIQISASERTTLEKIAQLAMTQPLAGFISTLEQSLGGNAITTSDSLLAALEKLYARVGANKSALFPVVYDVYQGICGIIYLSQGSIPRSGHYFLFTILFDGEDGMKPYLWYGNRDMILSDSNSTPDAIVQWLDDNGEHTPLSSPDEFYKTLSGGSINLRPGQVITCEEQQPNFILDSHDWVKTSTIFGGQNFTVSIVSRVNITQSRFTTVNSNPSFPGGVGVLFMEDFDMDPGTEWQAVTIQLFVSGNTYRFFINKCGYNSKNS